MFCLNQKVGKDYIITSTDIVLFLCNTFSSTRGFGDRKGKYIPFRHIKAKYNHNEEKKSFSFVWHFIVCFDEQLYDTVD